MNNQDINTMEGEILASENIPESSNAQKNAQKPKIKKQIQIPKINSITSKLTGIKEVVKKPRFIIISILIILIPIVYIGFILFNSNSNSNLPIDNIIPDTQKPEEQIDENLKLIKNDINTFRNELELLETDLAELNFPQVDLKVEY